MATERSRDVSQLADWGAGMRDQDDTSIGGQPEHQTTPPRRAITRRTLLGAGLQLVLASSAIAALAVNTNTVMAGDEDSNSNDPNNNEKTPTKPPGDKDEFQRRWECENKKSLLVAEKEVLESGIPIAFGVGDFLSVAEAQARIREIDQEIEKLDKQCSP
jgi:hypothetical protein